MGLFDGWGDLWDSITGAQQERQDSLEAQLREQNAIDATVYGPEWAEEVEANLTLPTAHVNDIGADVAQEFSDEWFSQVDKRKKSLSDILTGSLKTIFGLLPIWLWIAVAVGVFLYFGGGALVARRFAKKS